MNRITRGNRAIKKRKNILKFTRGFLGSHSKLFKTSNQQYMKAKSYSYSDRRKKKRKYRELWITRINGWTKIEQLKYKTLIRELKVKNINLNKKIIANLILIDRNILDKIIKVKI